ncbi:SPOR domain-containing protein [Erythrobacter sp. NAP1]|uniref:SPOR domain-containing protein n=1 Tax=Erythrobacter sp. NAP1 TaxID=237727 RepID=UPI0003146E5B|nr:SPOR domain-containing protein [Erythrobacter sp. NAP1]
MASRNQAFTESASSGRKLGLFVSTALASFALASCAGTAPPAQASFAKAQAALEAGKVDHAITHAEAAVLAEPRNPGYRAMLGAAYLEAGRFQSAATAFGESIELGESDPRTVLSYALAKVATGENSAALAQLSAFEDGIPPADLGLALALAGQPDRGVQYLINAVRQGHNSPKARQNLAYAYALAGNWPAARVMAAEDVPVDQIEARMAEWAETARPEDYQVRVATLLGVTPAYDTGLPQSLALSNFPAMATMVAEAEEQGDFEVVETEEAPVAVASAEPASDVPLPFGIAGIDTVSFESDPVVQSVDPDEGAAAPVRVAEAPKPAPSPTTAAPAPVRMPAVAAAPSRGAPRFVSNAVVQNVPAAAERTPARAPQAAPAPQQRRMAVASGSAATHLVQLGAFDSRQVAENKWAQFQRRYPDLKGRDVVITEALVNGRTYFRVAAAGFGSRSARSMCNTLKAGGTGCFAYSASNPPAGAVDRGVRIAAR